MSPLPHVACSDCERIRPGLVAQPANTVSSLAFVVAALPIWRRAAAAGDRPWQAVAVAAVAAGLGSVAYHGPGGRIGKAVHDWSIAGLVATTVGALARSRSARAAPPPPSTWSRPALTITAAVALHATSRTRGPLCRPDCWAQGHAGWHLLAAVSLAQVAARLQRVHGGVHRATHRPMLPGTSPGPGGRQRRPTAPTSRHRGVPTMREQWEGLDADPPWKGTP